MIGMQGRCLVFEDLREAFFKKFPYESFAYDFLSPVDTFSDYSLDFLFFVDKIIWKKALSP